LPAIAAQPHALPTPLSARRAAPTTACANRTRRA